MFRERNFPQPTNFNRNRSNDILIKGDSYELISSSQYAIIVTVKLLPLVLLEVSVVLFGEKRKVWYRVGAGYRSGGTLKKPKK